mmetsp:Transcript_34475/g.80760  ORF Transcript_34475/g.80760 Transcript_34475/m.80760 type:complete len:377 (+) Transcript_34475:1060-2190(+)
MSSSHWCLSAMSSSVSVACVASSTTTTSKRSPRPPAAHGSASMPAPLRVDASTCASTSSRSRSSARDTPLPSMSRSTSFSRLTAREASDMASSGPMRTRRGCWMPPSAERSPCSEMRETSSSTAAFDGAQSSTRGVLGCGGVSEGSVFAPGWGIGITAPRVLAPLRVSRAARTPSTVCVLPVPGGPCKSRTPRTAPAHAQMAFCWLWLYVALTHASKSAVHRGREALPISAPRASPPGCSRVGSSASPRTHACSPAFMRRSGTMEPTRVNRSRMYCGSGSHGAPPLPRPPLLSARASRNHAPWCCGRSIRASQLAPLSARTMTTSSDENSCESRAPPPPGSNSTSRSPVSSSATLCETVTSKLDTAADPRGCGSRA